MNYFTFVYWISNTINNIDINISVLVASFAYTRVQTVACGLQTHLLSFHIIYKFPYQIRNLKRTFIKDLHIKQGAYKRLGYLSLFSVAQTNDMNSLISNWGNIFNILNYSDYKCKNLLLTSFTEYILRSTMLFEIVRNLVFKQITFFIYTNITNSMTIKQ